MFNTLAYKSDQTTDSSKLKRSIYNGPIIIVAFMCLCVLVLMSTGCASVNTFPTVARAGDTVSLMVGGTEQARKETIQVDLVDSNGGSWNLADPNGDSDRSDSLVRSVFNLRPDGRASGVHYSNYLESDISWVYGHEPLQSVLVVDIPAGVPTGLAQLHINTGVNDDSSGIGNNFTVNLDIVDVAGNPGSSDAFLRQDAFGRTLGVDFSGLESAPYAQISFSNVSQLIGAVSIELDFDETVVNPDDLDLYVPQSNVRGSNGNPGAFGEMQRMVYWRQDGQKMYIDVIAPQGLKPKYLKLNVVHPSGLSGSPNFSLNKVTVYDIDGNVVTTVPASLAYFQ